MGLRRARATATPEELKGKYKLKQFPNDFARVMLKSQLSLHQRLREVEGVLYDVGLGDAAAKMFATVREEGVKYDQQVRSLGKGHGLGPPGIYAYMGLMILVSTEDTGATTGKLATRVVLTLCLGRGLVCGNGGTSRRLLWNYASAA